MQYSTLPRPCNAVIRYNKFNRRLSLLSFSSLQVLRRWTRTQGHFGALNRRESEYDR